MESKRIAAKIILSVMQTLECRLMEIAYKSHNSHLNTAHEHLKIACRALVNFIDI